jgi:hypothetical protein
VVCDVCSISWEYLMCVVLAHSSVQWRSVMVTVITVLVHYIMRCVLEYVPSALEFFQSGARNKMVREGDPVIN